MTQNTAAPIATRTVDGAPCVIGPAARVEPALRGEGTLTIEVGPLAGDVVRLRSRYDAYGNWASIAQTIDHPEHGVLLVAWIDTTPYGLAGAPALRAIVNRRVAAADAGYTRAAAMVPGCGNCGDCAACC